MAKLIFYGWEVGMRKIPFIKLLNEKAGLSLVESKRLKDRLVNENATIEVEIVDDELAKQILEDAQQYKVLGKIE